MQTLKRTVSVTLLVTGGLCGGCATDRPTAQLEANARWNKARADVKVQLAADQFTAGNLDTAAGELATANQLDPENPAVVPLRARILLADGRTREAGQMLEQAHLDQPQDAETLYLLGIVRQQQQHWPAALEAFREAATLAPEDVSYAVAVAQTMLQLGHREEALAYLSDAAPRFDWTSAYQAILAECHEQLGHWSAAASAWQRVSFGREEDAEIQERTATALYRSQRYIEAIPVLEQLVQQRGVLSSKVIRLMLADCCLEVGRATAAREQVERILTDTPEHLPALRLLARCHASNGDYQTALAVVRRALHFDRQDTRSLELGAALAWRLDDKETAGRFVERLLELDVDNPVGIRLQQRLRLEDNTPVAAPEAR
jgi:Tfp pilus assembly protein PilF